MSQSAALPTKEQLAGMISATPLSRKDNLKSCFGASAKEAVVRYVAIDDLMPPEVAGTAVRALADGDARRPMGSNIQPMGGIPQNINADSPR